jgi:beta-galactosidase/beta-glucuronidase
LWKYKERGVAAVSEIEDVQECVVPRPEHPRPQFVREDWLCLNGWWAFEVDAGDSGLERGLLEREFERRILVPFCPEAANSGIGETDRMAAVWYRRRFVVPSSWLGRRVVLHLQAVDYEATVWVNGKEVGRHRGGFTPISCDITEVAEPGATSDVVVRARDPWWEPQARGKQAAEVLPGGALYGRTTGIWQTVWLEATGDPALERPRITPDLGAGLFRLEQRVSRSRVDLTVRAMLFDGSEELCRAERRLDGELVATLDLAVPLERRRPWSVDDPYLYRVELELVDASGAIVDRASSYGGLRSVGISGGRLLLNGKPLFQRLVLDQGFYPEGVLTAPSDEALVRDIELAQAAGFNGARLHQKVFEERFLYHADRLGYLVWGEFADWGCAGFGPDEDNQRPGPSYITQWLEVLERDYSHPSIVGWCPLNETRQPIGDRLRVLDDVTLGMFLATKGADRTRPVLDASGYSHRVRAADVYDSHDYEQDPAIFARHHAGLAEGDPFVNRWRGREISVAYAGQPYLVSEFGGIWWAADDGEASWGYGERPRSVEEFFERFRELCRTLLENPGMAGYCYTQLTDVYQEKNGIVDFWRTPKLDLALLAGVQRRRAAIEDGVSTNLRHS